MSIQERSRALMQRRYQLVKHRQQSLLGRTAAELHLSSEISNYWNPIQGKLNPVASATYEPNHVALS
ncbi:MAG: hypothetical protein QNJ47_19460 [Nostocaceae cyanobacterium]|nr:hypothetical protein [Nostocaceae cyanobacterium]